MLLEQAGLLKEDAGMDVKESAETVEEDAGKAEEGRVQAIKQRYAKTDQAISELNVILVYKKVVQGLVYSPPDCEKYLALDAKPLGLSSVGSDSLAPTVAAPSGICTVPKGVCGCMRGLGPLACQHARFHPCCI